MLSIKSNKKLSGLAKLVMITVICVSIYGTVHASIPDVNGRISACYSTGTNAKFRIIDVANESCKPNETSLSWNQNGKGLPLRSNLIGADFTGGALNYWDLRGLNLSSADFTGANLRGADLTDVKLDNARLSGSYLHKAVMDGIDFKSIDLTNAQFNATSVVRSSFSSAKLMGTKFENMDLSAKDFSNSVIGGPTVFTNSKLDGSIFTSQSELNFNVIDSSLIGIDFSNLTLRVSFDDTKYSTGVATQFNLSDTKFRNVTFSNINVGRPFVNFANADFTNAKFVQGNLSYADLSRTTLTNVTWGDVVCPDLSSAVENGGTCMGHLSF